MKTLNFQRTFLFCPPFVPMDAFEQVKNSGKSMKKFTNAAVVINSNDKGLQMLNFVRDLQAGGQLSGFQQWVLLSRYGSYGNVRT